MSVEMCPLFSTAMVMVVVSKEDAPSPLVLYALMDGTRALCIDESQVPLRPCFFYLNGILQYSVIVEVDGGVFCSSGEAFVDGFFLLWLILV